ncbi:unnamed protein product [Bursaphelenchus okinawaensis]|uniref:NADH-cytochrome b5 reductase n=1 Tax=Bursaphelenchus okinawaensis TaxID=465554 RepID=A0A811LCT4_9BILA|nr:unnamed protein product [Bursaphelenchus okinawaensis]CAG9120965.1 unnamed protein product [Bursaphelenchus okinawaensis]
MDEDSWFYCAIGGTVAAVVVGAGVYYFWIREPDAMIYKSGQLTMTKLSRRYKRNTKGIVTFFEPHRQLALKLAAKAVVSHNVRRFRFALPTDQHVAGLEACQHVRLSAEINGRTVGRPYTPVSDDDLTGYVDLVIKVYGKTEKFPKGGEFSQHLDSLNIGDTMNFRGPTYKHLYHGDGHFSTGHNPNENAQDNVRHTNYKRISLIAGGTGITPILQVINKSLKNSEDKVEMALLFANQTENDILLREEMDKLHEKYQNRFKVTHILSQPEADTPWNGLKGYVTADSIKETLFPIDDDNAFVLCGPPAMREKAVLPALEELGVKKENIYVM